MALWDKTMINLQKGHDKLTYFAATFAERVKAEITVIRVRLQIDDVREQIGKQHRLIGQKLLELRSEGTLPQTFELFFKNSEIVSALEKIVLYERELENLTDELRSEAQAVQTVPPRKDGEGTL
jgi:hypothetical protein